MKSILKYLSSALMAAALGGMLTACDDWTEPKSVDLDYGTIDKADPAAYAKYLENLRDYRNRPHKKVYAWVENTADGFGSQAARLTAIPDSVDVIVLNNPTNITNQMMDEMKKVRDDKGMQVIYTIDFAAIKADWTALCEELAAKRLAFEAENPDTDIPAELQDPAFNDYMVDAFDKQLKHFSTYGFDGIMFAFDGKSTLHMEKDELAEYNTQANIFLGIATDWHKRNPAVAIDFLGKPQNITSYALLDEFRTIFLSESLGADSENKYSMIFAQAPATIPAEKLGMAASVRALDTNSDPKTGFFGDGSYAVDHLANWAAGQNLGAVGVLNVTNDYYLTTGQYSQVRGLIKSVNPIAK